MITWVNFNWRRRLCCNNDVMQSLYIHSSITVFVSCIVCILVKCMHNILIMTAVTLGC